jgi:fumarate reductase flavoprotein subunit
MEYTHWRVDARLVRTIFAESGKTIDWLVDQGVEFNTMGGPPPGDARGAPGGGAGGPLVGGPGGARPPSSGLGFKGEPMDKRLLGQAALAMKILTKKAKDTGVQFYMKTPAKKIIKRKGRIVGVVGEDSSGKEVQIDTKAVIIATGGFSSNKEWVKKYTGYEDGKNYCTLAPPGLTGDGIRMAWEVGAAATPMMIGSTHMVPAGPPPSSPILQNLITSW